MGVLALDSTRPRQSLRSRGDVLLRRSGGAWLATVIVGQLVFAIYIIIVYGRAALRHTLGDRSVFFHHGYVAGDDAGNTAVALHILFAIVVNLAGAAQLIPQLRQRAPAFHRWNGRVFLVGVCTIALAGVYMTWVRGAVGDNSQHVAGTLDAILIVTFAALALRAAVAREIDAHRRWALRLFMVVSGSWFFRLAVMLWIAVNRGPVGFNPDTFTGPFLTFMAFAEYLVPLAVLECYLRTQQPSGAPYRVAMATSLFALTLLMAAGIAAVTATMWLPSILGA
jgi:hypothetical protein